MPMPTKDLTGKRFGALTAISRGEGPDAHAYWVCRCDCGAERTVRGTRLTGGVPIENCGDFKCRPLARRRAENLTGLSFGILEVVGVGARSTPRKAFWLCRCKCGAFTEVIAKHLKHDETLSCGCDRRAAIGRGNATHGHHAGGRPSPEYGAWRSMMKRCHEPNSIGFPRYGARGIAVCDRWRRDFATFLADMGPKPSPAHSIDRIDGTKGYEPGNCRWATATEQARNLRTNRLVTHLGATRTLSEWAEVVGIQAGTIGRRLRSGWSIEDALSKPARGMPAAPKPPEYRTWCAIKSRCYDPRNVGYRAYGARGIAVCERWRCDFAAFYADMGPKPTPAHSIDRIDGTKGYGPGNCRWATATEQARNLRTNRLLTHDGQTRTLAEWAALIGVSPGAIRARIDDLGWDVAEALTIPPYGTRDRVAYSPPSVSV